MRPGSESGKDVERSSGSPNEEGSERLNERGPLKQKKPETRRVPIGRIPLLPTSNELRIPGRSRFYTPDRRDMP